MSRTERKKCPHCGHKFYYWRWRDARDDDDQNATCPKCKKAAWEKGYDAWLQ